MEPHVSMGILSNWLLGQVGFDPNKIDRTKIKLGLRGVLDGIEPAIQTPANVDAAIIASIENMVDKWVDELKLATPAPGVPNGPLVVGSIFKPSFTRTEVEAQIRKEGGDPTQFAPFILLILQFAPSLIQLSLMIINFIKNRKPVPAT